ncbi:MAG: MTH1187 family thiamine-binding protein [Gemmatimonadetes bacterium]|uniref:MTH1187 family thiamine-binding protein n=1 Tax=Candidatus Kutchimonas denitrificans TaxID=3056748 RepID=A0AAE4ZA35_9BACT|nr:MTH1187 family thiamine-binding protein [Gemmatimonadota bacterium]NIR76388.1 MTH1187 family thiamine-binding protein [Candidatus Kutchimonas denitrificans]NIS03198.1 MTH1187 family thiamine-binding protein [Gemmatimonadota bacterium]NIT66371.1 MTH1187 family thiamine-binding protein [Gemmatimonadota bacterium]NIU54450.1 MTH1187 family thiamine-binding protein [Gemmatimonadota bacterium]
MKATAEVQVIPIGSGVSVREEVRRAHLVLEEAGLNAQLHANGTNLEGELDDIFAAITRIHETLHAAGTARIATFIKVATRTDKEPSLAGKLF